MMATNSILSSNINISTSHLPATSTNLPSFSPKDTVTTSSSIFTDFTTSSDLIVPERSANNSSVVVIVPVVITGVFLLVALTLWLLYRRSRFIVDLSIDQKDFLRSSLPSTPDVVTLPPWVDQIIDLTESVKPRRSFGLRILKFDEFWEMDRSRLEIQGEIGSGCFGVVRKALYRNPENKQEPVPVAVKTVESTSQLCL